MRYSKRVGHEVRDGGGLAAECAGERMTFSSVIGTGNEKMVHRLLDLWAMGTERASNFSYAIQMLVERNVTGAEGHV